jgi:hypothetical protein
MRLLEDLQRNYDGPLPEAARRAARLGGAGHWPAIADRARERYCERMLQGLYRPQPGRVSSLDSQIETLRWRAHALATRIAL